MGSIILWYAVLICCGKLCYLILWHAVCFMTLTGCTENRAVRTLRLGNNKLQDSGVTQLAVIFQSNSESLVHFLDRHSATMLSDMIADLDISDNTVGDVGVGELMDHLVGDAVRLVALDMQRNLIGDDGAVAIALTLEVRVCQLSTLPIMLVLHGLPQHL